MSLTLFGIPNCDRCRDARKWLAQEGIAFDFHDLRKDGLDQRMLKRWCRHLSWSELLNNRSRTWRDLPASERQDLDEKRALALLQAYPTLVRRPLFETPGGVSVGFNAARKAEILQQIK